MQKAVMVIAHDGFRDEEFLEPKEVLEASGIEVSVASSSLLEASGKLGAKVKPDLLVKDIDVGSFAAVIFVGGAGASEYWDDPHAQRLAREASDSGKVLAAICIAPVTLARAGVLKGRRATVWPSEAAALQSAGADYTGSAVQRDGNIITASGPVAAREFAEKIVQAVLNK
ncbi:MAG: DJ-1/PfpI family protein [bacterium]